MQMHSGRGKRELREWAPSSVSYVVEVFVRCGLTDWVLQTLEMLSAKFVSFF